MPYKEKGRWRGKIEHQGKRFTAFRRTRKEALEWEAEKRKELKIPPRVTIPTGSLLEAATDYLNYCEANFSRTTFQNKRKALKELMAVTGNVQIGAVEPRDILNHIIMAQKTPNLANERRKHLSAFFEYCRRFQGLSTNPMAYIDRLPADRKPQSVPTEEEFLKLLMVAGRHDRNLLIAFATTGGRRSEILRWTWEDVNFQERTIRMGNRKNKRRELRYRTMEMNDELHQALMDQWNTKLPESDYVFQNRACWVDRSGQIRRKHPNWGGRYTARRRFMRGLCKRAGIDKRIGFHALRRFFASMLADNREKLPTIQKLLGHASVSTTDRYVMRIKDDTRSALNKITFDRDHLPRKVEA